MTEETAEDRLKKVLAFAGLPKVFYAVRNDKLKALPPMLQSYSPNANEDLMATLGLSPFGNKGEVYVYASEEQFRAGRSFLKQIPKMKKFKFAPIGVNPLVFMTKLQELQPGEVFINYGLPGSFSMGGAQLSHMESLANIVAIAKSQYIYIIEDSQQFAITMDYKGGKYVIGFLSRETGAETLAGMKIEQEGSRLVRNPVGTVVDSIQESDIDGIIMNPASGSQYVIGEMEMQLLDAAAQLYGPTSKLQLFFDHIKEKLGL